MPLSDRTQDSQKQMLPSTIRSSDLGKVIEEDSISNQKIKKPIIQIIRAHTLIEEKKRIRGKKQTIHTLLGSARIRFDHFLLEAPKIQLRDLKTAQISRGFRLLDLRSPHRELTARSGTFESIKQIIKFNKKIRLIDRKINFQISANNAIRFIKMDKTYFYDKVRLSQGRNVVMTSSSMIQDDALKVISLYGKPQLRKKRMLLEADFIEYHYTHKKLQLIGNVRMKHKNYQTTSGLITYILTNPNTLMLSENVHFDDGKRKIQAPEMIISNKNQISLIAKQGVNMNDKENQTEVYAQKMVWDEKNKILVLMGQARMRLYPEANIENKDSLDLIIESGSIEHNSKKKLIKARENITVFYGTKTFQGQKLDFDRKLDQLYITGKPNVQENGLEMQTKEIIFYRKKDELILSKNVQTRVISR